MQCYLTSVLSSFLFLEDGGCGEGGRKISVPLNLVNRKLDIKAYVIKAYIKHNPPLGDHFHGFYISVYVCIKPDLLSTLHNNCSGFISVAVTDALVKTNLGEKKGLFQGTVPDHSPSLWEAKAGS